MTDEEYDNIARNMNKAIDTGWQWTRNAVAGVGHAATTQNEFRDLPIWGLREKHWMPKDKPHPHGFKQEYEIVANAHLISRFRIIGSQMTYDEAVALKTMMES